MKPERICPMCGAEIKRCAEALGEHRAGYGNLLRIGYACENEACGFGLPFSFDGESYRTYICEEIRRRTGSLPADERARMLLASIGHCRHSGEDEISVQLLHEVEEIFLEALEEIRAWARQVIRRLLHREPDPKRLHATRCALAELLRFFSLMEDRYPSEETEAVFHALRTELDAIDYHYELGMLALEDDIARAEAYFREGDLAGGIRSRVAYVKYVLADGEEDNEENASPKDAFAALAPYSQEACYEFLSRATVGADDIVSVLRSYEEENYRTLSPEGRLAFLRLELTACVEYYEPALARLLSCVQSPAEDRESRACVSLDADRVLREMALLTARMSDQCARFSVYSVRKRTGEYVDLAAERSAYDEANALLEYVIGCCMYYESCFDADKHFDVSFLRVAYGHFSCFLASELSVSVGEALTSELAGMSQSGELILPSMIGIRGLNRIRENARAFQRALAAGAGIGEER